MARSTNGATNCRDCGSTASELHALIAAQQLLSERRACRISGLSRSVQPVPDKDEPVIAVLAELAERHPDRGFGIFDAPGFDCPEYSGGAFDHRRLCSSETSNV